MSNQFPDSFNLQTFKQLEDLRRNLLKTEIHRGRSQSPDNLYSLFKEPVYVSTLLERFSDEQISLLCLYYQDGLVKGTLNKEEVVERETLFKDQVQFWKILQTVSKHDKLQSDSDTRSMKEPISANLSKQMKFDSRNKKLYSFMDEFNKIYKEDSSTIYTSGDSEALKKLRTDHAEYLDMGLQIDSMELIHTILNSCPELKKISLILTAFQSETAIEADIREKLEASLSAKVQKTNSDLATILKDCKKEHQDITEDFFEIIFLKLRYSTSLNNAIQFLELYQLNNMKSFFRGGMPYHENELLCDRENVGVSASNLLLPDFMKDFHSENSNLPCDGFEDWLIWLKENHKFQQKIQQEPSKQKVISFLCSELKQLDRSMHTNTEKLWNYLRVKLFNIVFPEPRGAQEVHCPKVPDQSRHDGAFPRERCY